jgi:uncharacterized protein YecT (DUF1311 family)
MSDVMLNCSPVRLLGLVVVALIGISAVACRNTAAPPPASHETAAPSPQPSSAEAGSAAAGAAGAATAQPAPPSAVPAPDAAPANACDTAQTQAELTACWSSAADKAKARAEEQYTRVRTWIGERRQPRVATALRRTQLLWEEYRDVYCDAVAGLYDGGTVAATQRAHCRAALDERRATDLATLMSDASPQ